MAYGYGGCGCGSPGGYASVPGADDGPPGRYRSNDGYTGSRYTYRDCPICRAERRRSKPRTLARLLLWVITSAISSIWAYHVASGIPNVMTTNGRPEEIGWWLIFSIASLSISLIWFAVIALSKLVMGRARTIGPPVGNSTRYSPKHVRSGGRARARNRRGHVHHRSQARRISARHHLMLPDQRMRVPWPRRFRLTLS